LYNIKWEKLCSLRRQRINLVGQVLLLNADAQPVSYLPLSVIGDNND
jgi:hypothetical protein